MVTMIGDGSLSSTPRDSLDVGPTSRADEKALGIQAGCVGWATNMVGISYSAWGPLSPHNTDTKALA